ncbi:MAG: hypothetical protein ACI364_05470 [Coriobacteriales bacterium]
MEHLGCRGQRTEKVAEKRVASDEDADDDDVAFGGAPQRIAAVGLADVAVALAHVDLAVVARAERLIVAAIGEVDEEEVLTMEPFVDASADERADHDLLVRSAQPLRDQRVASTRRVGAEIPVEERKVLAQLPDGRLCRAVGSELRHMRFLFHEI